MYNSSFNNPALINEVENFVSDVKRIEIKQKNGALHMPILHKFYKQLARQSKQYRKDATEICENYLKASPKAVDLLKGMYEIETGKPAPNDLHAFCVSITALYDMKKKSVKNKIHDGIAAIKHTGASTSLTVPTDKTAEEITLGHMFGDDIKTATEVLPAMGAATVIADTLTGNFAGSFEDVQNFLGLDDDTIKKIQNVVSNTDFSKFKDVKNVKDAINVTTKQVEEQKKADYLQKNIVWIVLAVIAIFLIGAAVAKKM